MDRERGEREREREREREHRGICLNQLNKGELMCGWVGVEEGGREKVRERERERERENRGIL